MDRFLKKRVMQEVVSGNGGAIRDLLIAQSQVELLKSIKWFGEITANRLAAEENISIQNASTKLSNLYRRGYLERSTDSAESGGLEHTYKVANFEPLQLYPVNAKG